MVATVPDGALPVGHTTDGNIELRIIERVHSLQNPASVALTAQQ